MKVLFFILFIFYVEERATDMCKMKSNFEVYDRKN